MKKSEKAFGAVCMAAVPCFLFVGALSLWIDRERGLIIAIEVFAVSLLLIMIYYLLSRISLLRMENNKLNKTLSKKVDKAAEEQAGEEKQKESYDDKRLLNLEHQVDELYAKFEEMQREKGGVNFEQKPVSEKSKLSSSLLEKDEKYVNNEEGRIGLGKSEQEKPEGCGVAESDSLLDDRKGNLNKGEVQKKYANENSEIIFANLHTDLGTKKEWERGDVISIYKAATGAFQITNFEEMQPKGFKVGGNITVEMNSGFKSHNMGKLFEFNSQEIINHKIQNIIPVQLEKVKENKSENKIEVRLVQKGKIEVGDFA